MEKNSLITVISEECLKHENPYEPSSRLIPIYESRNRFEYKEAKEYEEQILNLVHSKKYIQGIKDMRIDSSSDTPINLHTYNSALWAARGAVTAAELLDEYKHSFALIRPPGHHASFSGSVIYQIPWGFCYFNNIAIATKYLIKNKKADRIAILDMDFHYGEGTQSIFKDNDNVRCFSIHGRTHFPPVKAFSAGNLKSFTIPIESTIYIKTLKKVLEEILEFKPDRIGISIGLDTHKRDMFAGSIGEGLETKDYYNIFNLIDKLDIGCYWILEGGYNAQVIKEVFLNILSE